MDIQRIGFSAELISKWIQERTDIQIRIFRPPNYSGTVAVVMLMSLVAGFLYLRRNNLEFLYNKQLWSLLAVMFCFIFVSGQMWNHIRSPPFVHKSSSGGVSYIHGSSQGQLVVETYIVMFLSKCIELRFVSVIRDPNLHKRRPFNNFDHPFSGRHLWTFPKWINSCQTCVLSRTTKLFHFTNLFFQSYRCNDCPWNDYVDRIWQPD